MIGSVPSPADVSRRVLARDVAVLVLAVVVGFGCSAATDDGPMSPAPSDDPGPTTAPVSPTAPVPSTVPTPEAEVPGPVLLVPGYGGSREPLQLLADSLRTQGRIVTVVRLAGNGRGDLNDQADVLDAAAQRALLRHAASSVDVVGYSAGGVIARLWVRDHGGGDIARRIVTLGSPHHGTYLPGFDGGFCPKTCQQLAPGSGFMTKLELGDETPKGPRWVSIWTRDDKIVTPPSSARLQGAVNFSVQRVCGDVTVAHRDLPRTPEVIGLVGFELRVDDPVVPGRAACKILR